MYLVDTHCHVDLYPDYLAVIEEVEREKIATIAVTTTPSVFRACQELTDKKRFVRPALGFHPELAYQRQSELGILRELFGETRYIGEVGLDFITTDQPNRKAQRSVFDTVLEECAHYGDKIVTIHSRRAAAEVVEMIGPDFPASMILHWFSGSPGVLETALAYGCYFSVNPAMIASEAGRRIVSRIPKERLLTESDGPFVSVEKRPAKPSDISVVFPVLAGLWHTDTEQVATIVYENFRRLLQTKRPG